VSAENAGEELGRGDWVLLCLDIDGILHGVGSYNHTVVCLGVSAIKLLKIRTCMALRCNIRNIDSTLQ
jgi:hypothetical protein